MLVWILLGWVVGGWQRQLLERYPSPTLPCACGAREGMIAAAGELADARFYLLPCAAGAGED